VAKVCCTLRKRNKDDYHNIKRRNKMVKCKVFSNVSYYFEDDMNQFLQHIQKENIINILKTSENTITIFYTSKEINNG